jgi:hypothetical protein
MIYWQYYSKSKFESCIIISPSHRLLLWLPAGEALLELKLAFNATTGQKLGTWRPAYTNPYGGAGRASPAPSWI